MKLKDITGVYLFYKEMYTKEKQQVWERLDKNIWILVWSSVKVKLANFIWNSISVKVKNSSDI